MSTPGASALGLGGGAVPSLGGGAMNLASLLGRGGLHTQINPLAGVLGGTTSLLGTSGVPNEFAGLCELLGSQQSHNAPLTNLQVVELQRDVAAQMLATEQQAAAAVHAKIRENLDLALPKVHGGEQNVLSEPKASLSLPTRKRMRSSTALQAKFNGTRGYSSEDDARGTRSTISGLRTLLRQAQARLQSRDHVVEGVLERLRATRNPHR